MDVTICVGLHGKRRWKLLFLLPLLYCLGTSAVIFLGRDVGTMGVVGSSSRWRRTIRRVYAGGVPQSHGPIVCSSYAIFTIGCCVCLKVMKRKSISDA